MAIIYGTTGHDVLMGDPTGPSNDTIFGLGGADKLIGGLGNNTLHGGAGADWADYSLVQVSYSDGAQGNDTYHWAAGDGNDNYTDTGAT